MEPEKDKEHVYRQHNQTTSVKNDRLRLLHICGISFMTTAQKAYHRIEAFGGPVGSLSRSLASFASPMLHQMFYWWLSILTLIDNMILVFKDLLVVIFPASKCIFDEIDKLAYIIEGLPKFFDDNVDRIPDLLHQLPLFNWASDNLIVLLKFLIKTMRDWNGSEKTETAMVDIKCDEPDIQPANEKIEDNTTPSPVNVKEENTQKTKKEEDEDIRKVKNTCMEVSEALEKMGMNEEKAMEEGKREIVPSGDEELVEQHQSKETKMVVKNSRESILELLEEGWQMKPL